MVATFSEKLYFCSWKVEVNFFHFSDARASERYFLFSGNVFLNEFSFCMVEVDFLSLGNRFLLFNLIYFFFLHVETFTKIRENKFFRERLCSGRNRFSTHWKLLSFIPYFFPPSGNGY